VSQQANNPQMQWSVHAVPARRAEVWRRVDFSASPPSSAGQVRATRCCLRSAQRSSAPTRPSRRKISTRSSTTGFSQSSWMCTLPACLKTNPQRGRQLQTNDPVAGERSPSGAAGTSSTRPTSLWTPWMCSPRSCWVARRATSWSTAVRALARSRRPTSYLRSASRAASTTAWASTSGRALATRWCAHRRETTPHARKCQASAGGSSRPRRATRPMCLTPRRR